MTTANHPLRPVLILARVFGLCFQVGALIPVLAVIDHPELALGGILSATGMFLAGLLYWFFAVRMKRGDRRAVTGCIVLAFLQMLPLTIGGLFIRWHWNYTAGSWDLGTVIVCLEALLLLLYAAVTVIFMLGLMRARQIVSGDSRSAGFELVMDEPRP